MSSDAAAAAADAAAALAEFAAFVAWVVAVDALPAAAVAEFAALVALVAAALAEFEAFVADVPAADALDAAAVWEPAAAAAEVDASPALVVAMPAWVVAVPADVAAFDALVDAELAEFDALVALVAALVAELAAALAAGDKVSLNFDGNSLIGVTIEQGTLNALVENGNAIRADGGIVVLTAKGLDTVLSNVVNNTGEIRAQTVENRAGKIYLLGDMEHGVVNVGGTLDASAPNGGNGGFIETSAARVKLASDAQITTAAATGSNGQWLIDPVDFTIATSGGDITGTQLGTLLDSSSVTIETTTGANSATNLYGVAGSNGDIHVNDAVSWSAANVLTMSAHRDINVNANITASNARGGVAGRDSWDSP